MAETYEFDGLEGEWEELGSGVFHEVYGNVEDEKIMYAPKKGGSFEQRVENMRMVKFNVEVLCEYGEEWGVPAPIEDPDLAVINYDGGTWGKEQPTPVMIADYAPGTRPVEDLEDDRVYEEHAKDFDHNAAVMSRLIKKGYFASAAAGDYTTRRGENQGIHPDHGAVPLDIGEGRQVTWTAAHSREEFIEEHGIMEEYPRQETLPDISFGLRDRLKIAYAKWRG